MNVHVAGDGPSSSRWLPRAWHALRLFTRVPSVRRVVGGLLSARAGLFSVRSALVGLIVYVAAVIATTPFGERFPEWLAMLGEPARNLFQVMTPAVWSMGIGHPVLEAYPRAWLFFVLFTMISTFTVLKRFIAMIVSAMPSQQHAEAEHTEQVVTARVNVDRASCVPPVRRRNRRWQTPLSW